MRENEAIPTANAVPMETRIAMIREAAAYANKEYMERCWVLDEKDNKKKWLWEKYDTPQVLSLIHI